MNLLPGPIATGLLSELTAPLSRNEETTRMSSSPTLVRRVLEVFNLIRFILLTRKSLWIRTQLQDPDERSKPAQRLKPLQFPSVCESGDDLRPMGAIQQ